LLSQGKSGVQSLKPKAIIFLKIKKKHLHPNTTNRQVSETSTGQNAKLSMYAIDIEKLKKELYLFAEVAIQNKLNELIQNIKTSSLQNENSFNIENVNPNLDLFDKQQATVIEFQDDEDENIFNLENKMSLKDRNIKPSNQTIDSLNANLIKTETVKSILSVEQDIYKAIECKWINKLYELYILKKYLSKKTNGNQCS
jgi:hypothetical protein